MVSSGEESLRRRQLSHSSLLRGAEPELVGAVLEKGNLREAERGEVLIAAGESNQNLYLLLSGRLGIYLGPDLEPLALLGPGDVVGELSLIDGEPASAQVLADSDCNLWVLSGPDLWSLLETSQRLSRNLLQVLTRRMRHLIHQQHRREYAHYMVVDPQTGLYSRRWLDSMLAREMKRSRRDSHPVSLVLMGIDLKGLGQEDPSRAENMLHAVSDALRGGTRPGEMIARYGRDEFMILLSDTGLESARQVGLRLLEAIHRRQGEEAEASAQDPLAVTAGVAQMEGGEGATDLIAAVDEALRRAGEKGPNTVFALQRDGTG